MIVDESADTTGRKVDTTNSAATATVAACAKMSQRRYMGMRER